MRLGYGRLYQDGTQLRAPLPGWNSWGQGGSQPSVPLQQAILPKPCRPTCQCRSQDGASKGTETTRTTSSGSCRYEAGPWTTKFFPRRFKRHRSAHTPETNRRQQCRAARIRADRATRCLTNNKNFSAEIVGDVSLVPSGHSLVSDVARESGRRRVASLSHAAGCSLQARAAHQRVAVLRGVESHCSDESECEGKQRRKREGITIQEGRGKELSSQLCEF